MMPVEPRPTDPTHRPSEGAVNPTRLLARFHNAFSLMSVIPLLICCWLITAKFFTLSILAGINGVWFLVAVLSALAGLLYGRLAIQKIIEQLVDTNRQLSRLYRMQADFVSNVAHEFRTPLVVIKGSLDNLGDGLHGSLTSDQLEPVDMCRKETNRLKRLVTDLLDVARLEAGKLRLAQEDLALQELLATVAKLFGPQLKARGLTMVMDMPAEPVRVMGDRDRLQQVFMNVVGNAIKFTAHGDIRLKLSEQAGQVRVEVTDTGPGIAPENLERIFDKFERVGTQAEEGSGLGLPIARDIIQLHRGRLWVESEVGKGSRFIVQLPTRRSVG